MPFKVHGFSEVIFSVRNLERDKSFYSKTCGWDIVHEGEVDKSILDFWNLPDTATADEVILKYPGKEGGKVRLISFQNVEQKHIRDSSQSWDTGGIYDVDVRVLDLDEKIEAFQSQGWSGYAPAKTYHFNEFHVTEILMRGSEDIVFAMIKRHAPQLEGYPMLKHISHVFNSSQIVKDIGISKDFFINKLGFTQYSEFNAEDGPAGPNVFGVPYNYYDKIARRISIVSPDGRNEGSVELVQLDGLEGRDYSSDAIPPNLGILMLRFPVDNLSEFEDHIMNNGVEIHLKGRSHIEPYGTCNVIVIKSPDGAWMEFYETT